MVQGASKQKRQRAASTAAWREVMRGDISAKFFSYCSGESLGAVSRSAMGSPSCLRLEKRRHSSTGDWGGEEGIRGRVQDSTSRHRVLEAWGIERRLGRRRSRHAAGSEFIIARQPIITMVFRPLRAAKMGEPRRNEHRFGVIRSTRYEEFLVLCKHRLPQAWIVVWILLNRTRPPSAYCSRSNNVAHDFDYHAMVRDRSRSLLDPALGKHAPAAVLEQELR